MAVVAGKKYPILGEDREFLLDCAYYLKDSIQDEIATPARKFLGINPVQLDNKLSQILRAIDAFKEAPPGEPMVDGSLLRPVKLALLYRRLHTARDVEKKVAMTDDLSTIETLNKSLERFDRLMESDWFKETETIPMLRLSDLLTIQVAEKIMGKTEGVSLEEREYDEKFNILIAPRLFLIDLAYFRQRCSLRKIPLIVAYMDIDDFKSFNTDYGGETTVDRDVLPVFMKALEAHIFSRGFAYREGGDEYVILLPNMSTNEGGMFLNGFQRKLKDLGFQGIDRKMEVSIGMYEVPADCWNTDSEIKKFAENAKNKAKTDGGKNCIFVCKSPDEFEQFK